MTDKEMTTVIAHESQPPQRILDDLVRANHNWKKVSDAQEAQIAKQQEKIDVMLSALKSALMILEAGMYPLTETEVRNAIAKAESNG